MSSNGEIRFTIDDYRGFGCLNRIDPLPYC